MYQSLAVKYRPTKFEEVCGQNITTQILEKAIETRTFKNVYLFAGASGCGKTTCARIFANEINHGEGSPIELDGGSNGGVDQIRNIIESANQRALDSEYKVFIIDECQMLGGTTKSAWAALLKFFEEIPTYTVVILCSTDPQKIPEAILNRVQRYNFSKIDAKTIKARLEYICAQEGFTNYEQTCDLISKLSNGCMRDAITNLEHCASFSKDLNVNNAKQVLSDLSFEPLFKLTWALQQKDISSILEITDSLYNTGVDLKQFINTYLSFILDLTKYSIFKTVEITNIPDYLATAENPVVQETVKVSTTSWFNELTEFLLQVKSDIKFDTSYKSTIEASLISFCSR